MPGIDEILIGFNRSGFKKRIKNDNPTYRLKIDTGHTIESFGSPEFKYVELRDITKKMMQNISNTLDEIIKTRFVFRLLYKV